MARFNRKGLLVAAAACLLASPAHAQSESNSAAPSENKAVSINTNLAAPQNRDPLDQRVERQHWRINHAVRAGLVTEDQAKKLRSSVDDIATQIQNFRQSNGGTIKADDLSHIESSLNQTSDQIRTVAESGHANLQSSKLPGSTRTENGDGTQDPKDQLLQMKKENKRELRQERQSSENKIQQQQLQYEGEMFRKLGEQKQNIIEQKDQLKDDRKESGAD
ncbi:MAG: hypothetical protein SGJ27_29375 [Candidatus Melainabacteria bacterium]|nr:hypothetical protein [Candidatus Melainabacteria bacterium]